MTASYKPAVVTPFCQADLGKISRCHQSVLCQTVRAQHFLVGDGATIDSGLHPNAELITLGTNNSNNGNTPRSVGALVAASKGFSPIFFLDVDNWYRADHVAIALDLHQRQPAVDVVISRRIVILDDGFQLGMVPEDQRGEFADTSCYCFYPSSYWIFSCWALMPRLLSPICDRVIFRSLQARACAVAWTGEPSCYFESHYSSHYQLAGRAPIQPLHDPDWKSIESCMPALLADYFYATGLRISSPL